MLHPHSQPTKSLDNKELLRRHFEPLRQGCDFHSFAFTGSVGIVVENGSFAVVNQVVICVLGLFADSEECLVQLAWTDLRAAAEFLEDDIVEINRSSFTL